MAVELSEVKQALEEINTLVTAQRENQEKRLKALEENKSVAVFDEKFDKLEDGMKKWERTQREWLKQQDEQLARREADELKWKEARLQEERKFEARVQRITLGLGGSTQEEVLKGHGLLEKKAYDKLLRFGAQQLTEDEKKVLTVANDATGGYLAPPQYEASIIKAIVLVSPFRDIVNVKQSGAAEYQQPKRTQTASARRVGEISPQRTETQNPAWGLMKIPSPEMYAEARISRTNLQDSAFDLQAELSAEFAEQFAKLEGAEVVSGNGVGQMLGILDPNAAGASTPIDFTKSGSAATIAGPSGSEGDGIVELFHEVKTGYAQNGRWVLNRASLGKVRLLKDTQGRYLWQPAAMVSLTDPNPATILGAPYTECPDMPNEGAGAFPIAFGDWKRGFLMLDRVGIEIVRDPFTLADVGQVKFSATKRTGGQVVLGEALRLLKCAS